MKSRLLLALLPFVFAWGCQKDTPEPEPEPERRMPSIEFLSYRVISAKFCEVELQYTLGNVPIEYIYFEVLNQTPGEDATPKYYRLNTLQEGIQKNYLEVDKTECEYKIVAHIITQSTDIVSHPLEISFHDVIGQLGIFGLRLCIPPEEEALVDPYYKIGLSRESGEEFTLQLECTRKLDDDALIQVIVGGSNADPLKEFKLDYYENDSRHYYLATARLPDNLQLGFTSVYMSVNGYIFWPESRINITSPQERLLYVAPPSFDAGMDPVMTRVFSGETDYLFYGNECFFIAHKAYLEQAVCSYNLETKAWTLRPSITMIAAENARNAHHSHQLLLTWDKLDYSQDDIHSTLSVRQYAFADNAWHTLTWYPGTGTQNPLSFEIGNNLYVGGGWKGTDPPNSGSVFPVDFWVYEVSSDRWIRKTDLPLTHPHAYQVQSTCTDGQKAYLSTLTQLWEYDPASDSWEELPAPEGTVPPMASATLLYNRNALFLIGCKSNLWEVWKYDLSARNWFLVRKLKTGFVTGARSPGAFFRDDKIYYGPGYFAKPTKTGFLVIDPYTN